MREIEILVKVNESKESALNKLESFQKKGIKETIDYYYDLKEKEPITKWLRIRKTKDKNFITFKEDHFKEDKWSYSDEYETEIKDENIVKKILENLGYESLVTVDNTKYLFQEGNFEIALEDVKNLGVFLEIEKMNVEESENVDEVRKEIFELIKKTGIDTSEEVHVGKPEMLMEKK